MQSNYWAAYLWPWRYRNLIWQFARREVLTRHRGSWLGMGWSVLTPLVMLLIYTLVFRHVFQARWPSAAEGSNFDFALNLYAGLIVFNWTVELLARAPRLILDQPNLVTKVVFPLPVLAWSALLAAGFQTFYFHCALADSLQPGRPCTWDFVDDGACGLAVFCPLAVGHELVTLQPGGISARPVSAGDAGHVGSDVFVASVLPYASTTDLAASCGAVESIDWPH
jgi:hypothetical protein